MKHWIYSRWGEGLRTAGAFLRDVIWPEGAICRGCGKISDGTPLCPGCRERLQRENSLSFWTETTLAPGLTAWSLRAHEALPRQLVLSLKYRGEACLAREIARLVQPLPAFLTFSPETVVTWVTMPRGRLRVRGIDHGRLLAEAVAEELGLPCRRLLDRRDDRSRAQARLNEARRRQNLKGAFAPAEPIRFPVLLVDDVLTTGTTARRCAEALRQGGGTEITVLTFTRAVSRDPGS